MSASLGTRRLSPPAGVPSSAGPRASMGENPPPAQSAAVPDDGESERGDTLPRLHSVGPDAYPNWDAIYLDNVERLYRNRFRSRSSCSSSASPPRSPAS